MTYGSEAWLLDEETCKVLNGANAYVVSHITGNHRRYEASATTCTFNLLKWIRARRHRWLGHILRLPDKRWKNTHEGKKLVHEVRLVKQAIMHTHAYRQDGDMLMDVDVNLSWGDLVKLASDRDGWKREVRRLQAEAKATTWIDSAKEVKQ